MLNSDLLIENGVLIKYQGLDTNIKVPYGIKAIEERAFERSNLEEIEFLRPVLPENNILEIKGQEDFSLYISEHAFSECSKLKKITLPEKVSVIGFGAFNGCTVLEEIIIPEFVSEINQYTFWNCSNLKTVYLPKTLKIIKNHAFKNCPSLEDVYLPYGTLSDEYAFDTERIGKIRFHYGYNQKR